MAEAGNQASLLSERLHKYGVLGAGLITLDPSVTMKHAQSLEAASKAADSGNREPSAATALVVAKPEKPKLPQPNGTSPELKEAIEAMVLSLQDPSQGKRLGREHIIEILEETRLVQGVVQQEISILARELAEPKNGKKKRKPLTFMEGYKKIQELNLPHEPLEDHGVSEPVFQNLLIEYQEDDELMLCAQQLLHPCGKGDSSKAKGIGIERIVEIHQFMLKEMAKVVEEFKALDQESRKSFTGKACEITAELLVSIAVEQHLSVRCEDVEQAVIMYDEALQMHPEFSRCTEMLAVMMQILIGATQDRLSKPDFLKILQHLTQSSKDAKVFAKKLYDDYRSKKEKEDFFVEAYQRFEEFSDRSNAEASELPELGHVEMQLCFEEYKQDKEVREAWDKSGAEANVAIQSMMASCIGAPQAGGATSSSVPQDRKSKKTKPSEIVEMQELMVDELKRISEVATAAAKKGDRAWKPELLTQMVQALASGAVERRYGISAEEMTMMGFTHAAVLQRNERFVRATDTQQEILMQRMPMLCQAANSS